MLVNHNICINEALHSATKTMYKPEILLPSLMDFTSTGYITPQSEAAEIFGGLKNVEKPFFPNNM